MRILNAFTLLLVLSVIGLSQGLVEKIVYSSDQSGSYDIWIMNPDGSEQVQLTSDSQNDYGPKISPDGTKIAFFRTDNSNNNDKELRIVDIDEQNDILVIAGIYSFAAWWPDGTKLIYKLAAGTCDTDAYTINLDGTGSTLFIAPDQLVTGDNDVYGIEFSENGNEVIWASQVGCWSPTLEIFKANIVNSVIDASSVVQLTNDSMYDAIGDWSVENGKIVYWHCQGGNGYDYNLFEIYTMDANGENKARLSENSVRDIDSRFSPDGEKIIFVTMDGDYAKIASMNLDGSSVEITTTANCNERHPDWGLVLEEAITVEIPDNSAHIGSSVFIPVQVSLIPDSLYRAAELNFSGYTEGLEFIGIDTVGTMIGGLDWTWAENEADGVLQTAFAGTDEITGEGVFCYLEFLVIGDICTTVPVNCDYALFNDVEVTEITNGSVYIEPIPVYGDVDENSLVQALDASDVLLYSIGELEFGCQTLANADVYFDSIIDPMDASIILQFVVDSIDSLPVIPGEPALLASGSLDVDDVVEAEVDASISIPVRLLDGENIYSQDAVLTFDPEILTPSTDNFITYSDQTDGFVSKYKVVGNRVFIAAASGTPNSVDGLFVSLNFIVNGENGVSTELQVDTFGFNSNLESDPAIIRVDIVVGTDSDKLIPTQYTLKQNYPNPFNPTTTIRYSLPEVSDVSIIIYDVTGREVTNLVHSNQSAGWYDVSWNGLSTTGNPVSTGLYFARIQAGGFSDVIKMAFIK